MPTARTYAHLSPEERASIMLQRRSGQSIPAIARLLARSPSTISRELRRFAGEPGQYDATAAARGYRERRVRSRN